MGIRLHLSMHWRGCGRMSLYSFRVSEIPEARFQRPENSPGSNYRKHCTRHGVVHQGSGHREERQSNELSCQLSECGQAAAVDKWIQTIAWFMEVTLDTPPYRPQAGRPAFHTSAALWQSRRTVGHWILFPSTKLVWKWGSYPLSPSKDAIKRDQRPDARKIWEL